MATARLLHPPHPQDISRCAYEGGGREVAEKGVQAGVEGAGKESYLPPKGTLPVGKAYMGQVEWCKTDDEQQQCPQSQADAVVDGTKAHKSGQWIVTIVDPFIVTCLLHLKWQTEEKEEVRDGQVEEMDVDGFCSLPRLLDEDEENEDVGWEACHEGDDVNRQQLTSAILIAPQHFEKQEGNKTTSSF